MTPTGKLRAGPWNRGAKARLQNGKWKRAKIEVAGGLWSRKSLAI